MRLRGKIESGHGDAAKWLGLFNIAYSEKVGFPVFPGSLNLRLTQPFDWNSSFLSNVIVEFRKEEYGGERDILLLACAILSCEERHGCLWTTSKALAEPCNQSVIEIISDVGLRETYSLSDGDIVEIEITT